MRGKPILLGSIQGVALLLALACGAGNAATTAPLSYAEVPGLGLQVAVASPEGIESRYGPSIASLIRLAQKANFNWLAVHAKNRAYDVSYSWRRETPPQLTAAGESLCHPRAGRYHRPFLSTPMSEFIIYGGILGEPDSLAFTESSSPGETRGNDRWILRGRISGTAAARLTPFVYWPDRADGLFVPDEARDLLYVPWVQTSEIVYEVFIEPSTHLVSGERYAIWSPDLPPVETASGIVSCIYATTYCYEYGEGDFALAPVRIAATAAGIPLTDVPDFGSPESLRNIEKAEATAAVGRSVFEVDCDLIGGLWFPERLREYVQDLDLAFTFVAEDFEVQLAQPDLKRAWRWLRPLGCQPPAPDS